jgi:hypothetical protein
MNKSTPMNLRNCSKSTLRIFILSAMLSVAAACNQMPDPPATIDAESDNAALTAYAALENEYASAFFSKHDDLMVRLKGEISGRLKPAKEKPKSDPLLCKADGGKSTLIVEGGNEVWLRSPGKGKTEGKLLFRENDPAFTVNLSVSASGKYIFIESKSGETSEIHFIPEDLSRTEPKLISPREPGHFYTVNHFGGDYLWILSNQHAPNRKLFATPVINPGQNGWNTAIMPSDSVFIEDYLVLEQKYLVLVQRKGMTTGIQIGELLPSRKEKEKIDNIIHFNDPLGRISDISYEPDDSKIIFHYSGLNTPLTCYTYGIQSRKLMIRWKTKVNGYNSENFRAVIMHAPLKNGKRFPFAFMQRQDLAYTDGSNPLLLCLPATGGNQPEQAFDASLLSLLDRGFAIAVADPGAWQRCTPEEQDEALLSIRDLLIKKQFAPVNSISLIAMGSTSAAAGRSASGNPGGWKSVVFRNPAEQGQWQRQQYPAMFIQVQDSVGKSTIVAAKMAARLRNSKEDHSFLVFQTASPDLDPVAQAASCWVFILTAHDMKK